MKFLRVPLIGDPRNRDTATAIRPDIGDVPFAGQPHTDATYLIAVPDDSPLVTDTVRVRVADADLDAECTRRQLAPTDVRRWHAAEAPRVREPTDEPAPTDPPPRTR